MSREPVSREPVSAKAPPHNLDAERAVLGSVLLQPAALAEVTPILGPGAAAFYAPLHRSAWDAVMAVTRAGLPVDPVTVGDELRRAGGATAPEGGWVACLLELARDAPSVASVAHYAGIVRETAALRRLVLICAETGARAMAGEISSAELLGGLHGEVGALAVEAAGGREPVLLEDAAERFLVELERRQTEPEAAGGIPTGLTLLDRATGGLMPGEFTVIGGRPGDGKTSLALGWADHAATMDVPVLIWLLEGKDSKLAGRVLSARAEVDGLRLRTAQVSPRDWLELRAGVNKLPKRRTWVHAGRATLRQIEAGTRRWRARCAPGGRALVLVDYLQRVRNPEAGRDERDPIGIISTALADLAAEADVALVAISRMNREGEREQSQARGGKAPSGKPRISQLSGSGQIEYDADAVVFIERGEKSYESDGVTESDEGPATISFGKMRDGKRVAVNVWWRGQFCRFVDPRAYDGASER